MNQSARPKENSVDRYQHPTNNAVLGAPPGMPMEQCGALAVTRIEYEHPWDSRQNQQAVASFWMPTPAELALMNQGRAVRLLVLGTTHPPLQLGVDGDGLL